MTTIDPILAQMLEDTGLSLEEWNTQRTREEKERGEGGMFPTPAKLSGVTKSAELTRILSLPRRQWEADAVGYAEAITNHFRAPGGTQKLRPVQAATLRDVHDQGGAFCPQGVGKGKTISSLLAFTVLCAKQPLLLIPAKLKEKTNRDINAARKHWLIPGFIYVLTYDLLSRAQSAELLEQWQPDVIVMDEAHRARNLSSATAKRIQRYMSAHPGTKMVALSGTVMKRSIADWSHIAEWCLRERSPAPRDMKTRTTWAAALDEKRGESRGWYPGKEEGQGALGVGALVALCTPAEVGGIDHGGEDPVRTVRRAFRRRLTDTPGVVATQEDALAMSLAIEPRIIKSPNIRQVCESALATWERPDGFEMIDGAAVWQHLRTSATGFYYRQNPPPPPEWASARKAWSSAVRTVLSNNRRGLDSELMVKHAIGAGQYQDIAGLLAQWEVVRPSYDPKKNREAVWFSDDFVYSCIEWAKEEKGIVWVEHVALGERLAAKSGLTFYQNLGFTKDGSKRFIEDHPHGTPMIAAREPNFEGRNLQFGWSSMLITTPHTSGATWEQLLGRLHRDGQEADEVSATVCATIPKMFDLFDGACGDARVISDSIGQEQKLCYADITIPIQSERDGLWD